MYFEKVKYSNRLIPKIAVEDAGLKKKKPQEFLGISPILLFLALTSYFLPKKDKELRKVQGFS